MRICIFTNSIDKSLGGPSRSVPLLAKGLSLSGIETTLFTIKSENMNTHLLEGSSVTIQIGTRNINDSEIEKKLLEGGFDLIHSQNLWMHIYHRVAKIARKHNIPYMMTPRGCLEPWCLQQKRLKKLIAMRLYQKNDLQKANCILATSDMEASNIRALGITAPIAVIPNGIDVSEYKCRENGSKSQVKKQICFLSRIHPKKGIEILIQTWEQLHLKYSDWNIVIAGNGDTEYISKLKQIIDVAKLNSCIKIIPPVFGDSKHQLYCESALFVLPTFSENFGMVIAEAMSCGLPVITTTGTPWHNLNENNLGWCINLSVENLKSALTSAIDLGMDNLFEMGQQCSTYISDNYQYMEVARRNVAVYKWIVNNSIVPEFVMF